MNKKEITHIAKIPYEAPVVEITEVVVEEGVQMSYKSLGSGVEPEEEATY